MRFIQCLFAVMVSCSAFAEKPFVDMTFPQALAEAKATNKLVMIDFYTTWCGPCKLLDKTTWKDEAVQKWLKENTVPLKVDAELMELLSSKYSVGAYPTIVFIKPDQVEMGRFVGYRPPETFIEAAEFAKSGVSESSQARVVLDEEPLNLKLQMDFFGKLVREEKYEDALKQYMYSWESHRENGLFLFETKKYKVALIFLVKEYPPALTQFEEWRDIAKEKFDSDSPTQQTCEEYFHLEECLGKNIFDLLLIYDELGERGDVGKRIKSWVGPFVDIALFTKNRFEEYLKFQDIDKEIAILIYQGKEIERLSDDMPEEAINNSHNYYVSLAIRPWKALIAVRRDEDADRLLTAILDFCANEDTFAQLRINATHAGRYDLFDRIRLLEREARKEKQSP